MLVSSYLVHLYLLNNSTKMRTHTCTYTYARTHACARVTGVDKSVGRSRGHERRDQWHVWVWHKRMREHARVCMIHSRRMVTTLNNTRHIDSGEELDISGIQNEDIQTYLLAFFGAMLFEPGKEGVHPACSSTRARARARVHVSLFRQV